MRNPKAVFAFLVAVLALAALAAGAAAPRFLAVGLEAFLAVPLAVALALVALSLARGARRKHQLTLGRARGRALAGLAHVLARLVLVLSVTAALSLAVFALLVILEER